METGKAYKSYVTAMQNYQIPDGRKSYQQPFADDFELIYAKVQKDDVNLGNANEYLNSLSKEELFTLQKYSGLAESIEIGNLSTEAAYNLLMHDNEQYDFNNNGVNEVGEGNIHPVVPRSMSSDVREAYIDGLNALNGKDRFMAMTLTFDMGRLQSQIDGSSYAPVVIDYDYLSKRVDAMLNPEGMAFTSEETKNSIHKFWEAFTLSYSGEIPDNDGRDKDTTSIDNFLKELREKGASGFLADLNMKKIEEKIEEFRKKLISELGVSPESLKDIEKMVDDFKKQLLEELQSGLDKSRDSKILDTQANIQVLLKMKDETTYSPLENLLQED